MFGFILGKVLIWLHILNTNHNQSIAHNHNYLLYSMYHTNSNGQPRGAHSSMLKCGSIREFQGQGLGRKLRSHFDTTIQGQQ